MKKRHANPSASFECSRA